MTGGDSAHGLFLEALDLPEDERAAWLAERAGHDEALLAEVASLLASHAAAGDFLRAPVLAASGGHPETIGPYRIERVLGEGGMGLVYLAEQTEPIRRRVALKVIKLGMDTRRVQERFQRERQALALMSHPSIAKVLEVGTTPRGQAFFAMEYVDGRPITGFCDEEGLDLPGRLELMVEVCHAVQHAHQKGILHRDLKPSNVLVAREDGRPRPWVIDFGVARALEREGSSEPTRLDGGVVGTPDYMSPEQAGVGGVDVDTRADVWSLGVLLHELVVGRRPYGGAGAERLDLAELRRLLDPDAPSPPPPRHSVAGACVPDELRWILAQALERDRARRYGTPNELAEDLARFLRSEPVAAGPPSRLYQLRKLVARNRVAVAAGLLVLGSLVVGLGTSLRANDRTREALGDYRSLADALRHGQLVEEQAALWPAWPELVPAMQAWIDQADALVARIPLHEARLAALKSNWVLDHHGKFFRGAQPDGPEIAAVKRLIDGGRCWFKLAGCYESSLTGAPEFADIAANSREIAAHAPDRLLWGTNWPHNLAKTTAEYPDDGVLLDTVLGWLDAGTRQKAVVDNPMEFFGFR